MFKLKWPAFPNPFWFSSKNRGEAVKGEVVSETLIKTCFDSLTVLEGEVPKLGTKVIVEPGNYFFVAKTIEEVEQEKFAEKKRVEERKNQEEEKRKILEKRIRESAEKSNKLLNIPVEWTSGFKSVFSGLSESGWGNGVNKKSVVHVLLKEDINEGKLKRKSGSFLCTTKGGSDGMQYVDLERLSFDDEGSYVSEITCKSCKMTALRWKEAK